MGIRKPKPPKKSKVREALAGSDFRIFGMAFRRRETLTTLMIAAVVAAVLGWWIYGRDFYSETTASEVVIAGNAYPVTEYRGIEASNDPEKMRACFRIREPIFAPPASNPQPRAAPGWFKCFYPERIIEELARGKAKLYLAEYNNPPGYDRIVVVYDSPRIKDLRAFMWRQRNENYVE